MLQAPVRDALQVLDWLTSRHVHEYLDVAGRPVGEGRAAAFQDVETEMQSCPYAGSRYHHAKPMNVTALRQMMPEWEHVVTMLSWLSERYRALRRTEITTYDDLAQVASAGVFLADFLVLRGQQPLRSREIPVLISGLYKACLGFQLATFLPSLQERRADEAPPAPLPDAAGFHAYLEAHELLIGEAEVCSGSAAMIMQAYDAMVGRHAIAPDSLPPQCKGLAIAWEQFDIFTHHAARMWDDLVQYVIRTSQFCPELSDQRLPAEVQHRLNACFKRRWIELLEGQAGLVVDIARLAQDSGGGSIAGRLSEPPCGPLAPSSSPQRGALAVTVLAWLGDMAAADMQTHAPVVASALHAQLAPYDLYEASVLAGLNEHISSIMEALGLRRPCTALTASALAHVCGRTPRDW